jgi:GR25 family glycosyltransferase involved in LPS biosynthesis
MIPYYINLDHRIDRKILVEREFSSLNLEFIRIPAILHTDGAIGCLKSHIKVLETCDPDAEYLWVCEDDIEFLVPRDNINKSIDDFIKSDGDILCLAFNSRKHSKFINGFLRTTDNQTTSCYIVKRKFRHILLDFWKSLLNSIETNMIHPLMDIYIKLDVHKGENVFNAADQAWKILQKDYIFLIPENRIAKQRSGYSDIVGGHVNYKC